MKEWGLITSYREYWELPDPVKTIWRIAASAEADAMPGGDALTKPTQDLLAQERGLEQVSA